MCKNLEILEKQEEILKFDNFTNESAFELGCFMKDYAEKRNLQISISIRTASGHTLFQHSPHSTNALNQFWMDRKFNLVQLMNHSSLHSLVAMESDNMSLEKNGLDPAKYSACGGGFPIHLKNSSFLVGAIITSNLHHILDHNFIIDALSEYLRAGTVELFPIE